MRTYRTTSRLLLATATAIASGARAETATLTVDVNGPGVRLPPMFSGLMTEEINHTFDGGLYAELIRNRTFQDDRAQPAHWSAVGAAKLELDRADPVNAANPVCLRVELAGDGAAGVANDGFWGIPVKPSSSYTVSFYAKRGDGLAGEVTAALVGNDGTVYAIGGSGPLGERWAKHTMTLATAADGKATKDARFVLTTTGRGTLWLNLVSLFPPTYKDAPGGLRPDLMTLLAGLRPSFIRLPGGNYLEGDRFSQRFDWKRTIGPVEERPGHPSCWGYRSSDGMGLTQMLLWCRQLGAEPVLGVFAGYTLNKDYLAAGPHLAPFVDEALEEIEYLTGGPETTWGKRRIADGLAEPFKLTYVEVGNEDWADQSQSYDGRFAQFYDAIKAKDPQLKIIASAPVTSRTPDLYDDHFYQSPGAMLNDANHYDRPADSSAKAAMRFEGGRFHGTFARGRVPDVLVGEWAAQDGKPTPTLRAGLADAVWLMAMERNADLIQMQCYAPLFVNVNPGAWQWGTNLIGYDALTAFGSPSYHAQAMIARDRPDRTLPVTLEMPAAPPAPPRPPQGAAGLGSYRTDVEYADFRVVAPDGKPLLARDAALGATPWRFGEHALTFDAGTIRPASPTATCWGIVGDASWTDYDVTVKARKNGGEEGFLVLWHAADLNDYQWWNIGGWGNTRTQFEAAHEGGRASYGEPLPFVVETGRWYDLRVEVRGASVRCFVDGTLVNEAADPPPPSRPAPLHASAGYIENGKAVVVRVVNVAGTPIEASVNLRGATSILPDARATVLEGAPTDVNTVDEPTKVAPKDEAIGDASASMRRTFPPYSLTVIRVGASTE